MIVKATAVVAWSLWELKRNNHMFDHSNFSQTLREMSICLPAARTLFTSNQKHIRGPTRKNMSENT